MSAILKCLKHGLDVQDVKFLGSSGGGCISDAGTYLADGQTVFVKSNTISNAHEMFKGECCSIEALEQSSTVKVPHPIKVIDLPESGAVLVMEHLDMKSLSRFQSELGTQLALLHKKNETLRLKSDDASIHDQKTANLYVSQFGFDVPTYCGQIAQENAWMDSWVEFFARKLEFQVGLLEKKSGDREARELWSRLSLRLPEFFHDVEVTPSLLHGDLWSGNAAETDTEPVVFDAASFYGHSEYDLGIAKMFGGFNRDFYTSYHKILPKAPNFERRNQLYLLFHHLNHCGHGVLLECTVIDYKRYCITDSSNEKFRYYVFNVKMKRCHKRKFDAKGNEIEPNFSQTQKFSTGYLPSSYKTEARGNTDKLNNSEVHDLMLKSHLTDVTGKHTTDDSIHLWVAETMLKNIDVENKDEVRVKTAGNSPFSTGMVPDAIPEFMTLIHAMITINPCSLSTAESFIKIDVQTGKTGNLTAEANVGDSWTDKIFAMKGDEPTPTSLDITDDRGSDDGWDD